MVHIYKINISTKAKTLATNSQRTMSYSGANSSYHHQHNRKNLNHVGWSGFVEYINPQNSTQPTPMQNNYNPNFDVSKSANSMMEQMLFYHQELYNENMKPLNEGGRLTMIQQNQIQHTINGDEDVLVVESEPSLYSRGKPRIRWTLELHERFLRAASELGGLFSKF